MTKNTDRIDYLLACLSEECHEVGKEAMKALRFGIDSPRPVNNPTATTAWLIAYELGNVLAVIWLLHEEGAIDGLHPHNFERTQDRGKADHMDKLRRMMPNAPNNGKRATP